MTRTALAIWHRSNKGKTETLREFSLLLLHNYSSATIIHSSSNPVPSKSDFRLVVNLAGKIIGVESQGDPNTKLDKRLIDLADSFKCDLILCSCRTKGETVRAVSKLRTSRGFDIIWTSSYQVSNKADEGLANKKKAEHILDLLQSMKLI